MKTKEKDQITQFNEWQDHQYNPGYWVNRLPPYFPPGRSIGFWIIALIDMLVIVPAFFFMSYIHFFVEKDPGRVIVIGILGAFSILMILRSLRLKPPENQMTQAKRDEIRRKENKERKRKLPNCPN